MTSTRPRRWPLGICELAWPRLTTRECAIQAQQAGFDHLDVVRLAEPAGGLAIPVGAQLTARPGTGWAWPAPPASAHPGKVLDALRACAQPRLEPWAGSLFGSDAAIDELVAAVPNVRLIVDVGHVAQWGGDPLRFLHLADHMQLRQAAAGRGQLPPDQGDVDFAALFARLETIGYTGRLSVEYFDLPKLGWPLADPFAACVALAEDIAPML